MRDDWGGRSAGLRFWAAALLLTAFLSGCASPEIKKKFIRNKPGAAKRPQVYTQKEFVKPYSSVYYYGTHYRHWKLWQEELIKNAEGNTKKRARAAAEAVQNIGQMGRYLKPEKAASLKVYQVELETAVARLSTGGEKAQGKRTLERILRIVQSDYDPKEIAPSILEEDIQL